MINDEFDIPESFFDSPLPVAVASAGVSTDSEPWPSRLPFDIALGVDGHEEILLRYDLSTEQLQVLMSTPLFQKAVQSHREDIVANGVGFKQKAKIQAETYLAELHNIVSDRSLSATVRLQAIQSVVKYAGLEPTPTKEVSNAATTTRLVFQWGDSSTQMAAIEVKTGSGEADGEDDK